SQVTRRSCRELIGVPAHSSAFSTRTTRFAFRTPVTCDSPSARSVPMYCTTSPAPMWHSRSCPTSRASSTPSSYRTTTLSGVTDTTVPGPNASQSVRHASTRGTGMAAGASEGAGPGVRTALLRTARAALALRSRGTTTETTGEVVDVCLTGLVEGAGREAGGSRREPAAVRALLGSSRIESSSSDSGSAGWVSRSGWK
ncbi:hypothetical protein PTTG_07248, partial [Puccinia triticina 1-1 BBBD Race 1]